ncbi:MAG: long-chain fatty acid--CoA ligase [Pseudomonadota bacterium]|nr:long-chain fatty acid--CoA ligase [Pseudomonadota bacterium]
MTTYPAYDWIAHHAVTQPSALACVDLHSGRRFTYVQMNARVDACSNWLRSLGVGKGDRVAMLAHNTSDHFEVQFACRRIGAIFLPLNWRLAVPELEFIVGDAEPKVLIAGAEFRDQAPTIARTVGTPHLAGTADGADSDYERALSRSTGKAAIEPLTHDDTWELVYTSGTTGRPKGARITHGQTVFNGINSGMKSEVTSRSVGLTFLPLFHVGGLQLYANVNFHLGATSVVMRTFDPQHFLDLLSDPELGITHAFGVPTNFLFASQLESFAKADLSRLVTIGIGGAAAPQALLETYADRGILLQNGWGMTETCTMGTLLSKERALDKIGSTGQAVMHTSIRIVDSEGNDLPTDETGELWIKGPTITPGYWNRPDANRDSFTDGWFHTGDAARMDEEGFVYIVDRYKDMYISGGENVYPAEVENVIYQLDGITEAAVVGVPDDRWGEVGRAFVVRKPGTNLTEEAIIGHCADNLAKFKVPKTVRFLAELPHNATGKITKHMLPKD